MSQFANKPSALLVVSDNFLAKQLTDSLHILGYKTVRAALARDCYSAWSSPERFSICLIDQHLADQQGQVLAKYLAENRAKNEQCHAGRESQRFLCPRQEDVNPEGILVNLHCGERADTVHDGPNLRELANNRHDFLKGIHGAGGCFASQLQAFRERREHFAIVVDEYGDLRGIVTLEDILEEIVGDIDDETDIDLPDLKQQPDGSYMAEGTVTLRDLNRQLGLQLPDDKASTLAGLIIYESRHIPSVGQEFKFHDMRFKITSRQGNQITSVRLWPPQKKQSDDDKDTE